GDIEAYGLPRPRAPVYLAFLGDCDGPAREFLAKLARRAGAGLRRIFSHCEGFDAATDLLAWMTAHNVPSSASYVNWVGRTVKPGRFRRGLLIVLLVLVDYVARHLYTRGHLARVQSIHFARWAFIDGKSRVVFVSNYDGSHQSYMDDFINKVGWGLNLVFSNG